MRARWIIGQLLVWGLGAVALRVAVVPAETCPTVSAARVRQAIFAADGWLTRNQQPDGRFLYGYDRKRHRASPLYNVTRHAGVLDALYRIGDVSTADRGLAYVQRNLVGHDDWAAFAGPGEYPSSGANGLLLLALVHRRERTGDDRYDRLIHELARFLLTLSERDGSVLYEWDPGSQRPVAGVHGLYSTGEVFYAFALLARTFPHEGWERHAHRIAQYMATRRDRVEGYSVRLHDHWAAYGLLQLRPFGLTPDELRYARFLAGYFGWLVRFDAEHLNRGFHNDGASLGTQGEAIGALRRLAAEEPRLGDLRSRLDKRSACMASILVHRQTPDSDGDDRAAGAWFDEDYTQMDDQQHAIAALLGAEGVLR